MKLSLSTNWCNRTIPDGEVLAEKALSLGFDEIELGYCTTREQADGFRKVLSRLPVGSVHAFCPIPLSAPQGYPELYSLASFDENERAVARVHVLRNIRFAADIGADTVVLHAGRVSFGSLFRPLGSTILSAAFEKGGKKPDDKRYAKMLARAVRVRRERGEKMLVTFRAELEKIVPALQEAGVTLALENMPYYEGFPLPAEMAAIRTWGFGPSVAAWFDTGHARVCAAHGWLAEADETTLLDGPVAGMHLNDVKELTDDHLAPGFGSVDFKRLKPLAERVRHVVFEPNALVSEADLRTGIANIRRDWNLT